MITNYYDLLGIMPDASLETIRQAYRQAAMKYHPDRGGSDEQMKAINFAFEILSDPRRRADYDRVRAQKADVAAQAEWAKRTEDVRQKASEYPKEWSEFAKWMDSFISDVKAAQYGSQHLWGPFVMPTATGSVSAGAFIAVGAVLGGVAEIIGLSTGMYPSPSAIRHHLVAAGVVAIPLFLGAWVGRWAHGALRDSMSKSPPLDHGSTKRDGTAHTSSASPDGNRGQAPHPPLDTIQCVKCGKKLRVPRCGKKLVITCPSCKNKFAYRA